MPFNHQSDNQNDEDLNKPLPVRLRYKSNQDPDANIMQEKWRMISNF